MAAAGGRDSRDSMDSTAPLPRVPAGPPAPPPYGVPSGPAGAVPVAPRGPAGPDRQLPRLTPITAAALVAIALVSGLLWWVIRHDSGGSEPEAVAQDPLTSGQFRYEVVAGPENTTDCAANSYGKVEDWFAEHSCDGLSRALYVTETGGQRALVSVVQVTMSTPELAQQLKVITDTDNTGNVNDLVRDGTANIPGAPEVAGGEYDSKVDGGEVTIVEARLFDDSSDRALLSRITEDALRLGGVGG